MLFRKKIERACVHCVHSAALEDEQVLCSKKGVREQVSSCRKFKYDPCKRIPPRRKPFDSQQYEQKDYSL